MQYESPEFSEELKKRTNANAEYRDKAKGMNWKTLITVAGIPFAVFTSYSEGEIVERKHVPAGEIEQVRKSADFIVDIPTYELSVEMATGKKSLESLFMSRAIKVDGSIFKALQYRSAIERYSRISAELANESMIPSKEDFVKALRERGLL